MDNILTASKIIEIDGVEGFYSARKLVGHMQALALLTMHLRKSLNTEGVYGNENQVSQKVKDFLKHEGLPKIDSFRGEFRWLSNFWLTPVELYGHDFPSVEHAYQAAKTTDLELINIIKNLDDPKKAKEVGSKIKTNTLWEKEKLFVMQKLIDQKFDYTNPLLFLKLEETLDLDLIEGNNHGDTYWGTVSGIGENKLGKILMLKRTSNRSFLADLRNLGIEKSINFEKISKEKRVLMDTVVKWSQLYALCNRG